MASTAAQNSTEGTLPAQESSDKIAFLPHLVVLGLKLVRVSLRKLKKVGKEVRKELKKSNNGDFKSRRHCCESEISSKEPARPRPAELFHQHIETQR